MTTRILICDDSALARKQMARALPEELRGDVSYAKDGLEALEKLRRHEAELMFLDLNMPEMDGYQVLEQIRKEDLPVMTIVVSGDIQPEARERVKRLGALDFIKKPTETCIVLDLLVEYGLYRPGELEDSALNDSSLKNTGSPAPEISVSLNDYLQEISNVFADASFKEMAEMLHYDTLEGEAVNVEVLMDMSSILFGAFLKGIGDQLDLKLGLGHPTVLGQHRQIYELLEHHSAREEQLLCIEICYTLEDRDIECDMLILLTEDSVPFLEDRLQYLVD